MSISKSLGVDVHESDQTINEMYMDGLISIEFHHRPVTDEGQNPLCSSLKQVVLNMDTAGLSVFTRPIFSECRELIKRIKASALTDSILEEYQNLFSNLPHLENLMLSKLNISRLTNNFFSRLPELEYLEVRGYVREIDPDTFTGMPSLKNLKLVYITLEESHLESLKSLPNLEDLTIQETTISNVNALRGLQKLNNLSLISDSISKFNSTELKENLPNLRSVNLAGNPLDPEFVEELKKDKIFHLPLPF